MEVSEETEVKPNSSISETSTGLLSLPADLLPLITQFLETEDIFCLYITCKTLQERIWEKVWHDLVHVCGREVEDEWNSRVETVSTNARFEGRGRKKHPHCDGYCATEDWDVECSVFPWKTHYLSLEYNHCPRDVDILVWYEDGKKHGYTML